VKGKGFDGTPVVVSLVPQTGDSVTVKPTEGTLKENTFEVVLPTSDKKFHPGCWQVQVKVGELTSNLSDMFAVLADPSLDSAERSDKFIYVKGTNLIDYADCGGRVVSFKLKKEGADAIDLNVHNWVNDEPVLILPDKPLEGEWKVQVFMEGKPKNEKPLTLRK
jgi:hypothetical protein